MERGGRERGEVGESHKGTHGEKRQSLCLSEWVSETLNPNP
jgi:hypothetical protein